MRITKKDLQAQINRINDLTGNAREAHNEDNTWNVGSFVLDGAYGGWRLERIVNESGAVENVLNIGFVKPKELSAMLHAFERGIELREAN